MNWGFETTQEDIETVLDAHGLEWGESAIQDFLTEHNPRLEKAALCYNEQDDQTASMLDEVENILIEESYLVEGTIKQFRTNDYVRLAYV